MPEKTAEVSDFKLANSNKIGPRAMHDVRLEVLENEFASSHVDFVIHCLIKKERIDELYNLLSSARDGKKCNGIDRHASELDNDGLAAMHYAARQTSTVAIRLLLDNGVHIDTESRTGETPLHVALRYQNASVAEALIAQRASLTKTDAHGNNALHLSIESGLRETALKILQRNPSLVPCENCTGHTALHLAARQGDVVACEKLLSCEAKITTTNINGETPLHLASLLNRVDVLKLLLSKGCLHEEDMVKFLSIQRNDKLTALHIAAKMGHLEAVNVMLDMGVPVSQPSNSVASVLQLAAQNDHIELIKLLLSKGATVNAKDRYKNTALHVAAMNGQTEVVRLLLTNEADIDAINEDGWTPLFFAVSRCHLKVLEILLENGADCNKLDLKLCCCLHYAVKEGHGKVLHLLLQYCRNDLLFQRNVDNRLLLHESVLCDNEMILEMLLNRCSGTIVYYDENKTLLHLAAEQGKWFCLQKLVNIWPREYLDMQDSNGQTALHLAANNGYSKICRLLIDSKADAHLLDKDDKSALNLAIGHKHNLVLKEFIDANVEISSEDASFLPMSGNVEGLLMVIDHLSAKYVGRLDYKFDSFGDVLDSGNEEIIEAIVVHESFKQAVKFNNMEIDKFMPTLIARYPDVALKVLDKGITFSNHELTSQDLQISYDFAALETRPEISSRLFGSDAYFGPGLMAELDRGDCLAHPLTQKLMTLKWNRHGSLVFYSSLLLYMIFVMLLTILAVLERNDDLENGIKAVKISTASQLLSPTPPATTPKTNQASPANTNRRVIGGVIFTFASLQLLKEIMQMFILQRHYFKEPTNLIEWITYGATLGYLKGPLFGHNYAANMQLFFGVSSVFFAWLNVMLFMRRSPLFNIYVVMFTQVFISLLRVLFVFMPLLLAFALAYNQLYIAQPIFENVGRSLMKTFVMFSGELEYSSIIPNSIGKTDSKSGLPLVPGHPFFSYLLIALFIIMVTVALMNLLVGLAVGDIESIRKTAKYNVMKQQARYIQDLDSKCPMFVLKWAYTRFHTVYPNKKSWLKRILPSSTTTEDELQTIWRKKRKGECSSQGEQKDEQLNEIQKTLEQQNRMVQVLAYQLQQTSRVLRDLKTHQ